MKPYQIKSNRYAIKIKNFPPEYGADIHHEDGEGCTSLHHAAREGHVQIAARFLEAGAQVLHEFHHSAKEGHVQIAAVF